MRRHGLPTADFRVFDGIAEARAFAAGAPSFRVVKADGLAAGKGVVVARDAAETAEALESMLVDRRFGDAGARVVLEEALEGEELSVMALTDGRALVPLLPTQDHKRVFDRDQGPNTGGMGAYGPVPQVSEDLWRRIEREILGPCLEGIRKDRLDYRGVIYIGLMLTAQGPRVLEFNVRFGDPETQVILPMGEGDWGELLLGAAQGRLEGRSFRPRPGAAVTVVLAAGGYPGDPEKGRLITGLDAAEAEKDVLVFHAGTARAETGVLTAGGRVLGVTGLGRDIPAARERAYAGVRKIRFDGAHYRTDIGARALAALPGGQAK
jgi:phosphoribosylamine--glycine ligase